MDTFKRAFTVLNDLGIGFAVHSLEQHSPLPWGVQQNPNPYDMAPLYDSDHNALRLRCATSGFIMNSFHAWLKSINEASVVHRDLQVCNRRLYRKCYFSHQYHLLIEYKIPSKIITDKEDPLQREGYRLFWLLSYQVRFKEIGSQAPAQSRRPLFPPKYPLSWMGG